VGRLDEPLYPVNLRLKGERVLVVGGGRVAEGKVRGLLDADAEVTVVAPQVIDSIAALPVAVELQILSFHQQRRAGRTAAVVEPVVAAD